MATFLEKRNSRKLTEHYKEGMTGEITFEGGEGSYAYWKDAVQIGQKFPGESKVECYERELVPIGNLVNGQFSKCEVVARYHTPKPGESSAKPNDPVADVSTNIDFSVETVSVDGTFKYDTSGGDPVPGTMSMIVPTIKITQTYKEKNIDWSSIRDSIGKVNSSGMTLDKFNIESEKLLFTAFTSADGVDEYGNKQYQVTASFVYNRYGWNNVPKVNGATITWHELYPNLYQATAMHIGK